jgi:hypothetical protein
MLWRPNRFSSKFFFVLQSKKKMKVIGNLVFFIFALIFSSLMLLWAYQEELIDEVGAWAISSYKNQYDSEWKETLRDLRTGQTQTAIALLEGKKWGEIQNRDRVYLMKRKLLETLADQLHSTEQYGELLHWSGVWRALDERDVTAMAYWYEALRHTLDRREEGTRGLKETWQRFPSNEALTRFLTAVTLVESGDSSVVAEMRSRHRQQLMDAMLKGWRVIWNWRIQQALAKPVRIELARHLRSWQLIAAWHDAVGISRTLWSWRGDERLRRTGYTDFSISPDDQDIVQISLRIPKFMTTLRIDPPPGSRVRISDIQIVVDDVIHSISISQLVDQRHYKRMVRKEEFLESQGADDPWVRMNIVDIVGGSERKVVDIVLKFRAAILLPAL